jgi:hypothetical protein
LDPTKTPDLLAVSMTLCFRPATVWPGLVLAVLLLLFTPAAKAGIVTLTTSTAVGTASVISGNDFVGVLDGATPPQIAGTLLNFNGPIPAGESFLVGDVVGRDVGSTSGSRNWEYNLLLPDDALIGTGFENIVFNAHAFERDNNNLVVADQLTWGLFLNGSDTPVASGGTIADFSVFDLALTDPGGAAINQITVRLTVAGFNGNNSWFAARGLLSARYQTASIPEPGTAVLCLLLTGGVGLRQRRR